MPPCLTDGPGPFLRPFCRWVSPELGYPGSVETLLLMHALCIAEDGDAFHFAGTLVACHAFHAGVYLGHN